MLHFRICYTAIERGPLLDAFAYVGTSWDAAWRAWTAWRLAQDLTFETVHVVLQGAS